MYSGWQRSMKPTYAHVYGYPVPLQQASVQKTVILLWLAVKVPDQKKIFEII